MPLFGQRRNRHRRKRYVLDRATQSAVAWHLLLVLLGIGALYAFAVFYLMGPEAVGGMTVEETRRFLLLVHVAYFSLGGAILAVAALLITHRFVGPAYVMRQAVEAMRRGDYDARLTLRKGDYLQSLSAELIVFRAQLVARQEHERRLLGRAVAALDAGDLEGARVAVARTLEAVPEASPSREPLASAS